MPDKKKKPYTVEGDLARQERKVRARAKASEAAKAKKKAAPKKVDKGDWLTRLRKKVKMYMRGEKKKKKKKNNPHPKKKKTGGGY